MEIMDPFAYELLACPPPPGFDTFSADGDLRAGVTVEQVDDYFRAIGVLPPRPTAAAVVVPPSPTTPAATLVGAMDYATALPATSELYAAAVDAHARPSAAATPAAPKNPYDADIDASLRAMERDAAERPSPDYLDTTQAGRVQPVARAALVLWMVDFCRHFDLDATTLHRGVSYADRFLSARPLAAGGGPAAVERQLRLLGAAALYAAAKFEDRAAARRLGAWDIAADCGFASSQEVLATERALVAALRYRLGGPTARTFVEHFTRHVCGGDEAGLEAQRTALLLADASLFDHNFLKLLPSAVAAAAILLERLSLTPSYDQEQVVRWSRELQDMTGYKPADLKEGVETMYSLMLDPGFRISPLFFQDHS